MLMTPFQSVFWSSLCFLLTLLFAVNSPFDLCLFLLSFAFLLPYSAYLSVLSNFLARFPRLALRLLLLAFFGCSVSFFSSLFSLKTLSPRTWVITISSGWQSLSLSILLLCDLFKKCKILRITVQLQPHQFDLPLKTRVANYLLTRPRIY